MMNLATTVASLFFSLITEVETFANETLSSVKFSFQGRRYELTRFRAGRVEVYEVDPSDGIAMFLGYYDEIGTFLPCLHARAIAEGHAALERAHEAHWSAFLPGADRWSQPSF